ncbi:activating transcription factor 7-interacting protein 1 isoform X4 [Archocentrus centrarchus]|uniref:activating transcription factor 7-interacting protein 1 isoform X4 n=1 Tax=Archocentrus centrarchus TaxID=63155 RepID=UPI0011E9D951|nr:activating transcription factor 7-interacting protein 1 isoform X4 [Archocentrus centrarchus]
MEVIVTEEKKKIFRARKTMKISDRQQLESLHSTLLTVAPGLSNPSPPPLMNGTHKEDGQKVGDKEQNNILDLNTPQTTPPVSPTSLSSPAPSLTLNLSPSPPSSSPKASEENTAPRSPMDPLNFELKKVEEDEKKDGTPSSSLSEPVTAARTDCKGQQEKDIEVIPAEEKKEEEHTVAQDPAVDLAVDSVKGSVTPVLPAGSDFTEPMETDSDTTKETDPQAPVAKVPDEKLSSPRGPTSDSSSSSPSHSASSCTDRKQSVEIKDEDIKEEETHKADVKKGSACEEKMEVDSVKVEPKKEKTEVGQTAKPSRPSSTPPSDTAVKEERSSTSGLKRTLSEGSEKDGQTVKIEGKRPKMEREELEAQLELKITTKAGSHHKLGKIVQQLVEERLKVLELTIFDKHFQELKDRVDKIDCATKHQAAINTLQAKIARLSKKFGEANQASENKRKQEALAAVAAAAKTAAVTNNPQAQRPGWTSMEVKQTPTTVSSSSTAVSVPTAACAAVSTSAAASAPTSSSSTAMVQQAPILQLITSNSNPASTLATGSTTQSQTGTLLLKTAPGSGMVATGQPLLIQLPLSVNGQAGTLVNIPVSSLSAASSLNKAKTTASTATFILKPAPATTTVTATAPAAATVPALHGSSGQMSSGQISLARAVYQGGAGGITTPNAGVSVTTARTPAQSVSVVGAMSSVSSPATSGPAATGSTAPGPPQGMSLTSKTDNQVTGTAASKAAAPATRPKGSVIDLTEDDDDVQVTGVKNATVTTPSPSPRTNPVISIPNNTGARASPISNQNISSNPQLTVHHRPPVDTALKSRSVTTTTPTRGSSMALPPLPSAPAPPRLPPEAERTSPPQQPQLKLVQSQTGIVLSWCVGEVDRTCAAVESYHLYAFHQDNSNSNASQQHWKKIGEVKALPLPMACTLTQFQSGSTYHFAVRAKDVYGRFGSFCEPQCTNVISSSSS